MKEKFIPLRLQIIPNWYQILVDNNLDSGINANVLRDIQSFKIETNDIWKGEINFTILESNPKEGRQLIFNDDYKYFSSSVDFDTITFSHFPKFWIKESVQGYDIGISFREMSSNGNDKEIVLTNLPYGLFRLSLFKFGMIKDSELKSLLEKNEWKDGDIDPEGFFKNYDGAVVHKYLNVYWRHI